MNKWIIYCHINKINGKRYIGQTRLNTASRWRNGNGYKRHFIFYQAIQKYGWENFNHEILEENILDIQSANEREKYWIAYYHTYINDPECNGYNMTPGGDNKGIVSEETKQKIGLKNKHRIPWNKGLHGIYSEETLSKIRTANCGRKFSDEVRKKVSQGGKGKKRSQVTKDRIAKAKRKKVRCIELDLVFESITAAAEFCKCSSGALSECLAGNCKTIKGYHWEEVK